MTKQRARNWFLTIWNSADCFNTFKDVLLDLNCTWAYILHQPEENEKGDGEESGLHYHLIIFFENARTFQQVQKLFFGSHIEVMKYQVKCARYLMHLDDKDKIQYSLDDVITNILDFDDLIDSVDMVAFTLEDFKTRIESHEIDSLMSACEIYGIKTTNKYRCLIKDLLEEHHISINQYQFEADNRKLKIQNESLTRQITDFYSMYADIVEKYKILNEEYNKKGFF